MSPKVFIPVFLALPKILHRSPMHLYHPAPTSDFRDSVSNPKSPDLPHNPEVPFIDAGFFIDDTITTGWNTSSFLLLINGIVSLLWAITLAVFSSGVVSVDSTISQYGKDHLEIINALLTLIGTASTTHLKYTFQGILEHYSHYVLVDGFTLSQLTWMQGINEWSLFTAFDSQIKRLGWLVIYTGMAFHSASVVSVLQPSMSYNSLTFFHSYGLCADTFYKSIPMSNPIPCATDPGNLSLDVADILPQNIQSQIDQLSYRVGLQLGNYVGKSYFMPRSNFRIPINILYFSQRKLVAILQLPWQVVPM